MIIKEAESKPCGDGLKTGMKRAIQISLINLIAVLRRSLSWVHDELGSSLEVKTHIFHGRDGDFISHDGGQTYQPVDDHDPFTLGRRPT